MIDQLKPLMGKLCTFAKDRMGFKHPPKLFLKSDAENSQMALGRTAHYDPDKESITLYITNRHPKDILRSLAHELVHHTQNLRGDLAPEKMGDMGKNYAQDNDHMRNMEKEAYLQGNMCFRDWEDGLDNKELFIIKLAESNFLKQANKEKKPVNIKELKETIRQVVEAATEKKKGGKGSSFPDFSGDDKITQKDVLMAKGVIPKPDEEAQGSEESESEESESKAKKSNIKKENNSMTTKITKEFLEETIRDLLQKQINEETEEEKARREKVKNSTILKFLDKKPGDDKKFNAADVAKQFKNATVAKPLPKSNPDRADRLANRPGQFQRQGPDARARDAAANAVGTAFPGIDPTKSDDYNKKQLARYNQAYKTAYVTAALEDSFYRRNPDLDITKPEDKKQIQAYAQKLMQLQPFKNLVVVTMAPSETAFTAAAANKMKAAMKKGGNQQIDSELEDLEKKLGSPTQKGLEETSVGTPEKENALYEQRFTGKNTRLFEKLVKEWTK